MADGGTVKDIETFGFLAGGYAEWDIHSEPRGTSDSRAAHVRARMQGRGLVHD